MGSLISLTSDSWPDISGYIITERLYVGTRTAVYRAVQTDSQRPVVIKVLRQAHPSFGELVQFRNQYTIMRCITNENSKNLPIPGIIQPLTLEPFGSGYALVMEDWGGVSLNNYTQQKALDLVEVLTIALQLADILHGLCQHQVVHKDIKPDNILISPETKQVKLIDFNIASLLPKETQEIQSPNILEGTLAYLAPEQTGRMNRGIDYRADFYALGVTLYQLLSGSLPFISEDPLELVHCHIAKIPVPLNQVNSAIPEMVAAIVSKLMAKNAEDRYQSAIGLKHDLQQCLTQWQETGEVLAFELGQRDVSDRFLIPEKLYGREAETQALLAAFDRVATGSSELVLVAGFSGIGKTAIVNEVHKPITRQNGYFIKGKFDQFNRNIPLSAFVQALRDLMGKLLCESDRQLAQWKAQILEAVGENGQVLIDVIPELGQIIGTQTIAPELSGSAVQNRFNVLLQKFIGVFTTADHPLVIFLDDLQWADLASLQLIKLLMNDNGYLLMLGAYRDNEVSAAHPFILTVEEIKKSGAIVHTITLESLTFDDTNRLVADTLNCPLELAQPLAKLIDRKTQGNPFFTTQFFKSLHEDGQIHLDQERRYWTCDIAQVNVMALTDDVVEFMAVQLQKLPLATQQVLKLAACVGNQFDLTTLAIVSEQFQTETANLLWPAIQECLIVPTSQVYKFFQVEQPEETYIQNSVNPAYRFLHDRIQQAAYSLIAEDNKEATHLQIGQLLSQNASANEREERLFEIVNHLNAGRALITTPQEQELLAELNLKAGQKAKTSTAYQAAVDYYTTGIALLPTEPWEHCYDITLALHTEVAESAYLSGNIEQMDRWIQIVQQQAKTLLDQVRIYEIKLQAFQSQGQQLKAIEIGREILQQLDIFLPESVTDEAIYKYAEQTLSNCQAHPIENLADLPLMTDPKALVALKIMISIVPSVHQTAPYLFPIIACEEVKLSLKYGNSPLSTPGYADFGIVVNTVLNKLGEGYQFGQLALNLIDKLDAKSVQSMTNFKVAAFNQYNQESIQDSIRLLKESYTIGLESGDMIHAFTATFFRLFYTVLSGRDVLETLLEEIKVYQANFASVQHFLVWSSIPGQTIENLITPTQQPAHLIGAYCDESTLLPVLTKENDELTLHILFLSKLILSYLFNQKTEAFSYANQGERYLKGGAGMFSVPIFYYYDSLARLSIYSTAAPAQQQELLLKVHQNQDYLKARAQSAPMNFQHHHDLVEAELHRVLGLNPEALQAYDRAISKAHANHFIQDEALANELAAKFYLDWGKEKVAAGYMQEAYYCYAKWGAKAKTNDLEARYPQLLQPILQAAAPPLTVFETFASIVTPNFSLHSSTAPSRSANTSINTSLDFAAILKASQSLAGTIELNELLHQLTQIILQNSGGDRCALILPNQSGDWSVAAIATPETTELCAEPLEGNTNLPTKLIQYVKNTQEVVVIDNLITDLPVIDDYLTQRQPKSLLCLPILNQGKLMGILYLKNRCTSNVFTNDRLSVLNFLCTQAAISLENARLYQDVNQSLQEIHRKETQYRGIFEAVNEGLAITDLETGKLIAANPAYCDLHGYSYEDLLEMNPFDLIKSENKFKFLDFLTTIKSGQEFTCESVCTDDHGKPFYVDIKSVPFSYNGKLCGLSIMRNVTERRQMELAIQQKNQNLEQAMVELQQAQLQTVQSEKMASLGNLVAGVAHEINNPIGFLNGSIKNAIDYTQDLLEHIALYQKHAPNPTIEDHAEEIDLEYLSKDFPKLLSSMKGATDRIKGISTSLRTFSRADTEHKVSANLHEGIDSTLLILKYRLKANEHRPEIQVLLQYGDLPDIQCFPGQLNQVFMNILANAIDALDESNMGRSFADITNNPNQITISTILKNDHVKITIADNGKGMPDDVKSRIFDHLFTTKGVGKGTGLGLAIARQIIIETHDGILNCNSVLGKGTEFEIQIPM